MLMFLNLLYIIPLFLMVINVMIISSNQEKHTRVSLFDICGHKELKKSFISLKEK